MVVWRALRVGMARHRVGRIAECSADTGTGCATSNKPAGEPAIPDSPSVDQRDLTAALLVKCRRQVPLVLRHSAIHGSLARDWRTPAKGSRICRRPGAIHGSTAPTLTGELHTWESLHTSSHAVNAGPPAASRITRDAFAHHRRRLGTRRAEPKTAQIAGACGLERSSLRLPSSRYQGIRVVRHSWQRNQFLAL